MKITNLFTIGPFHNNYEIIFGVTPWFRVYIPGTKCSCNHSCLQSEWSKTGVAYKRFMVISLVHWHFLWKTFWITPVFFFLKTNFAIFEKRSLQQNTLWNLLLLINCSNTCSSKVFVCQEDSGCSRIVRLMEMFHTDIILIISFWKIQFSEFSEFSESIKKFQNFAKLDYAINWQLSFIQWHFENSLKSWTRQITPCLSM